MPRSSRQKSVLVVRLSHVTDVVMASPMAYLIKRHSDNVHLTWVVQAKYAPLLVANPDIDNLITWDKDYWLQLLRKGKFLKLYREIILLKSQLRRRRFDIALDLQGVMFSSFITWLSGTRIRIALGATQGSNWFATKTISRNIGEETQLGSEYRYLLSQIGMPDTPWQMVVAPPAETTQTLVNKFQFPYPTERYAVICPFSVFAHKRWPDEYWKQISLRIRGRYQLKTVILGLERDTEKGGEIATAIGAISLVGKTTYSQAGELIKHAKLVIGIDTGLMHLGHAFRTPTIGLFGSTCPYSYAGVETSKIIYQKRYCSPCNNKPICSGRFDCMKEITPDIVLSELKPLMKIANEKQHI
ncbi:glycosyltransferase family 9 protein [Teredinibacter haidensis]|uniref:glycosyltransferase family 9 protein n=1 Tax=Teredinibacter haidensis TaxID=2731755 RepID=UPI000948C226|nr:glycosyltransferase family 9 protein [Teredinibacter haidensis]